MLEEIDAEDLEALKARLMVLERIIHQGAVGVLECGLDGRLVLANPALARMLGYDDADAMLRSGASLAAKSTDAGAWDRLLDQLRRQGKVEGVEMPFATARGTAWLRLNAWLVPGPGGVPALVEGLAMEVTRQHADRLALMQAMKMDAVGRLAGGVAHDFNNLLSVILGYAELAAANLPAGPERSALEEIEKAARRAAEQARQLTVLGRRQALNPKVFDLGQHLRQSTRMLERLVGEQVNLRLELTPAPLWILADIPQINQVMVNLAINAHEAMPDGGSLAILARLAAPPAEAPDPTSERPWVCLEFADTGSGMDEAVLARIFEPYFTTKTGEHATGLGLATVHGIVRQSNGFIQAHSVAGQGATFRVFLPQADPPGEAKARPEPGALLEERRVLLAEDEPAMRALMATALEREGCRVTVVRDGAEALERLEAGMVFDLLVTDAVMPALDGVELARRSRKRVPDLPILFVSGYAPESVLKGPMPENSRWLPKPLSPGQLIEAVRDMAG